MQNQCQQWKPYKHKVFTLLSFRASVSNLRQLFIEKKQDPPVKFVIIRYISTLLTEKKAVAKIRHVSVMLHFLELD